MIQLDTDQLLSAAQQLELTKLAVVSLLISIMLMFAITVFALIVFGRKSSRHADERDRLNANWQATFKDVAKQLTEEFTPLVNTIGRVVMAVSELQRDITGSVDGLSTNVSSVAMQVSELVTAVGKLSQTMEENDVARQKRYDELFTREADTASRIDRIEIVLGGVKQSLDHLGTKVGEIATLAPDDRVTIRRLFETAQKMLSKYGGQIEALKEDQHEQHEPSGDRPPTAGGAAAGGDGDGGTAGNAGDIPDEHGGRRNAGGGRDAAGARTDEGRTG